MLYKNERQNYAQEKKHEKQLQKHSCFANDLGSLILCFCNCNNCGLRLGRRQHEQRHQVKPYDHNTSACDNGQCDDSAVLLCHD
jgi:hypothetical protein